MYIYMYIRTLLGLGLVLRRIRVPLQLAQSELEGRLPGKIREASGSFGASGLLFSKAPDLRP